VGDEAFQRKCLRRISERMKAGATLLLVSHDPTAIERICRRVVVLDSGKVSFDGPVADGLLHYHRMLGTETGGSRSLRPGEPRDLAIAELEVKDSGGRPRHLFRTGEPLRVELSLECRAPIARAVAALEVRDERGEACFRTEVGLGAVMGPTEVAFDISRLALLGGDYDLAVGAQDQDSPGPLERVVRFSVVPSPGGKGVADLRGTWTVTAREEAVNTDAVEGRAG
jgi:hypothetical protein